MLYYMCYIISCIYEYYITSVHVLKFQQIIPENKLHQKEHEKFWKDSFICTTKLNIITECYCCIQFPSLATVSTDNLTNDPLIYLDFM
jgi:hypothetical protein